MAVRPIYSSRLLAWAASSSPPPYSPPAGTVVVVRDLDVTSGGGSIINCQLSINGVAKFWVGQFTVISIPQALQWRGRQILMPGEELLFQADGATDGAVSGYVLLAP